MKTIGVIMGGVYPERELSLKSGRFIADNIDRTKYNVKEIILNSKIDIYEKVKGIDFALLILHGKFGEDGVIQTILETCNIPYSGCGPLTSALCMDKNMCKKVLLSADILTAPWTTAKSVESIDYNAIDNMGYPVFIKPNNGGFSAATFLVKSKEDVESSVKAVLEVDKEAIIEGYVKGEEITSFVLNGEVLPSISISTGDDSLNFVVKYVPDGSRVRGDVAFLPSELQDQIDKISKKCWDELNCEVYAIIDFIVKDGVPYVLELNTLPVMTETGLIAKSAKANGLEYAQLLDKIIELSMNVQR